MRSIQSTGRTKNIAIEICSTYRSTHKYYGTVVTHNSPKTVCTYILIVLRETEICTSEISWPTLRTWMTLEGSAISKDPEENN